MRFLSVADRELLSAARQKATYRTRWITAAVFFGLLVWLLWAFHGFSNRRAAPDIFRVFSVLTFLYCLYLGTASTADCISVERREGTLGLLFLTNLNSAEIIAGKLCSTALASVYGLMAVFPMLALLLLMGGITLEYFARTVLGLLNGILFALAAGFLASVICRRQFIAIALAAGLTLSIAGGLMLGAAAANSYGPTRPLAIWLAGASPLYTLMAADSTPLFGPNRFWHSAAAVAGMSLGWLGLTTFLLARAWRDRPKSVRGWRRLALWRRSEQTPSAARAALRRRLLGINPFFWLAGRQPVSGPVFMSLAVVLVLITVYVEAPLFERVVRVGTASPVLALILAWLWTGMAIHALVLYYAAMSASQPLAEDKQNGALELILSTPITEESISRGLWLAYARKMLFPALLAVLVHWFFIWMVMVMATLEPPGRMPPGVTPGEFFWSALLDKPLRGRALDWPFSFLVRAAVLILLQLMVTWPTLGWVGRWLGLRMKHPGFAPMASLALLLAPPALLFSLACYLAGRFHLDRLPERQFFPMMMWLAFAIGCGHCLLLSVWAATRLRHDLRPVAMSRYQPLPPWRWRLPGRRAVIRFASATAALAALVASIVAGYYGYQNWRGKRAWTSFQTALKQSGQSLDLSLLLPEPVPDNANLARSSAFLGLLSRTNRDTAGLFQRMSSFDLPGGGSTPSILLMDWNRQTRSPLYPFVRMITPDSTRDRSPGVSPVPVPSGGVPPGGALAAAPGNRPGQQPGRSSDTNRQDDATAILQGLQPEGAILRELAAAAARLPAFQASTNRDPRAVLRPARGQSLLLERLHLLFQMRACAALALDRDADAAEDLLAGLRLARLARQLPDIHSTTRVQGLLMRSLQPLWEGLRQHAWTEPQLAAVQQELAGFDLLADYTNAVRRVVLANIEIWRAIPNTTNTDFALLAVDRGDSREPAWQLQPRAWWYECCIQLHNAGRESIGQVDAATGRIQPAWSWFEFNGLPLDSSTVELFMQSFWRGVSPSSVAFAQTSVNQATIACALERFRLARRVYPKSLDQLVPSFLARVPHDAVSGRPIIYQFLDGGGFILRGVGPNGTDDRNRPGSDDWLWTYSPITRSAVTNSPSAKKQPSR